MTAFNKACMNYVKQYPGRVITTELLASMIAQAYQALITPINVLSGFKKAGVYPFNPSEIDDRQLAPSTALRMEKPFSTGTDLTR